MLKLKTKPLKKNKQEIFLNEVNYRVAVSLRSVKPVIAQVPFLAHSDFTQHCRADCSRACVHVSVSVITAHLILWCIAEIAFLFIAVVYFWSLMGKAHLVFSCVRDVKLKHSALIAQTWAVTAQTQNKMILLIKVKSLWGSFS